MRTGILKTFLSVVCLILCSNNMLAQVSYTDMTHDFTWEGVTEKLSTIIGTSQDNQIKIIADKNSGQTNPTVNSSGNDVRIYANGTVTIESIGKVAITKVEFTVSNQKRLATMTTDNGLLEYEGLEKVIWSGNATSFSINIPSKVDLGTESGKAAQFCFKTISITYNSGTELEDPKCAFSAESATCTLGEAFSAPNFTTVSDGEITYKSSNPEIATVDNSGNITAIAAGTTTITASVATTDTYAAGSASYTLTVVDPSILFTESFAESLGDFTVNQTEEVWSYNSGYKCAFANGFGKGAQELKLISPVIDLTDVAGASLTFEHAAGYIKDNDLTKDFTLWIKEKDATEWSQLIIPTYADSWTFVNSGEISLNAYCGKEVQIAFNYMCTENVASAWEIKNVIIKKAEPTTFTISVSDAGYATYFTDQAWVVADNMKAGIVTGVENKNLTIDWKYTAGSVVPANTAVLIQADAKEYVCEVSNSEEEAPANNLLKGSTTAATTEGENCLFYKLSYDNGGKNLGFYWAAENGAAFQNEANKAYLALTTTVAKNVRGFGLEGDGTTGIGQVENGEALVNVYTIDGIIVRKQVKESQALNGLKKGIYIVNGKKVIK